MSEQALGNLIRTGVVVLAGVVTWWSARIAGRRLVKLQEAKGAEHAARAATLWVVVRRLVIITIVLIVILLILSIWGFSLAPLLAVGTVIGAALGFGAQDLVKDFIAGFFILAEDQFHVGDTVTIAGTTGMVEDIQLRVTVLRDLEGNEHFVPNGQIIVTSNFTSQFAKPVIDVGISYDSDVDKALAVMADELTLLSNDPDWTDRVYDEIEILGVNKLDDSAVILRGRLTTVADERWNVRREALRRIKRRFDAEGITIPFPQLTVHMVERPDQSAD